MRSRVRFAVLVFVVAAAVVPVRSQERKTPGGGPGGLPQVNVRGASARGQIMRRA